MYSTTSCFLFIDRVLKMIIYLAFAVLTAHESSYPAATSILPSTLSRDLVELQALILLSQGPAHCFFFQSQKL